MKLSELWNTDAPEGQCWQCPDCESRASLGGNAAFHASTLGHRIPTLKPIFTKPSPAPATETATPETDAVYLNLEGQDCDAECYETLITHARDLERRLTAVTAERDVEQAELIVLKAAAEMSKDVFPTLEQENHDLRTERDAALRELTESKTDTRRLDWLEKREITNLDGLRPTIRAAIDAALDSALSR